MYDYTMTVLVNKNELLSKLKNNKDRYVKSMNALKAAWKETNEKYQKLYELWSAKYVAETLSKDDEKPEPPRKIEDRTEDYALYIDMIEAQIFDEVELDKNTFDMLWRDNWNWMKIHTDTIRAYACNSMDISVGSLFGLTSAAKSYNITI